MQVMWRPLSLQPQDVSTAELRVEFEAGIGFCAEHAAVAEMLKSRESVVRLMVAVDQTGVVTPPCGRFRELLWQLNGANREMLVVLDENTAKPLEALLPYR